MRILTGLTETKKTAIQPVRITTPLDSTLHQYHYDGKGKHSHEEKYALE
jgi:hypothetical protein